MNRREAGFTLVEVLVALALTGMVTITAYSSVRFAAILWARATDERAIQGDRLAVITLLRHSLGQAYPAYAYTDLKDRRIAFDGTETGVSLIAPLPQAINAGVMAAQRFYTARDGDGVALFVAWSLDLRTPDGAPLTPRVTRLSGAIERFQLGYYGTADASQPADWHSTWRDMTRLPELVRADVWRRGHSDAPWISVTIAPKVTVNTSCMIDPIDSVCRRYR